MKHLCIALLLLLAGCAGRLGGSSYSGENISRPGLVYDECRVEIGALRFDEQKKQLSIKARDDDHGTTLDTAVSEIRLNTERAGKCKKIIYEDLKSETVDVSLNDPEQSLLSHYGNNFTHSGVSSAHFIFFVLKENRVHSPWIIPGFIYTTVHLLSLGLIPLWMPEETKLWILSASSTSPQIKISKLKNRGSVWFWSPWLFASKNTGSADEVFRVNRDRLYKEVVLKSFNELESP